MTTDPARPWLPGLMAMKAMKRCGAKTRAGHPCRGTPMPNGRCRMHGGKSTGPRAIEGLAAVKKASTKYGLRSKAYREEKREARRIEREISALIGALERAG